MLHRIRELMRPKENIKLDNILGDLFVIALVKPFIFAERFSE